MSKTLFDTGFLSSPNSYNPLILQNQNSFSKQYFMLKYLYIMNKMILFMVGDDYSLRFDAFDIHFWRAVQKLKAGRRLLSAVRLKVSVWYQTANCPELDLDLIHKNQNSKRFELESLALWIIPVSNKISI